MSDWYSRARLVAGPVVGACAIAYFTYHGIHGERGLLAWRVLEQRVAEAQIQLEALEEDRRILQSRVDYLYPKSLHPDLLDEWARRMLNYAHPEEIIIFDR